MKTTPIHVGVDDHDRIKLIAALMTAREGRKVSMKEVVSRMVKAYREAR